MSVRLDQGGNQDRTRSPRGVLEPGFRRAGAGEAVGQAFQEIGGALRQNAVNDFRVAEQERRKAEAELQEQKRAQNAVQASKLMAQFQLDNAKDLRTRSDGYDGTGEFSAPYMDGVRARKAAIYEQIGDDADLKLIIDRQMPAMMADEELRGFNTERGFRQAHTLQEVQATTQLMANGVLSGDIDVDVARENIVLSAAGIGNENERQSVILAQEQILADAYVSQRLRDDPIAFEAELNDQIHDDFLTPQDKAGALSAIEVEKKRREREAERQRREAERQRQIDMRFAKLEQKQVEGSHFASIMATGQGVDGMSPEAIERVQGKEARIKFERKQDKAYDVWYALGDIATLSPSEQSERLNALAPVPGSPQFSDDQEIYSMAAKQIQQVRKLRATDPAASVLAFEGMAESYQAFSENPSAESFAVYAEKSLAAQEDVGIAPGDRRILTNEQAERLADNMSDPNVTGQDRRNMLQGLSEYGEYQDQVMGEIVAAGGDESLLAGAFLLDDRTARPDRGGAKDLLEASGNRKELVKTTPKDTFEKIEANVVDAMGPLFSTYDAADNRAAVRQSYTDQASLLAMEYMSRGMSRDQAVSKAVASFTSRYDVIEKFRVPQTALGGQSLVNVKAVYRPGSEGAKLTLPQNLPRRTVMKAAFEQREALPNLIDLDDIYVADYPGLSETATRSAFVTTLGPRAQWVTSDDESGVELFMRTERGLRRVVRKSTGEPFALSWDEIYDKGEDALKNGRHAINRQLGDEIESTSLP